MRDYLTSKVVKAQIALSEAKNDETGAAGVEYGILVVAVSAVIVVAAVAIGGKIGTAFDTVNNAL